MFKLILYISLLVSGSIAAVVPFIKQCPKPDSDCPMISAKIALEAMASGVKELGIPPLDPLSLKDFDIGNQDLKVSLKNVVVHRLSQCTFNKIARDPIKSTGFIDIECPVTCVGNYKASGKILLMAIEGEGPFEVKVDKLHLTANIKFITTTKDGKEYYKISGFDYTYEPLSKFTFKLGNLFNGDKAKADPIEKLLDSSWKELALDPNIGKPIAKEVMKQSVNILNKFFQAVPVNELIIV